MSFYQTFKNIPFDKLLNDLYRSKVEQVDSAILTAMSSRAGLGDFLALISPAAEKRLEEIADAAHSVTVQRFGRTIQLYAPLYLSNKCKNNCVYCGFRRDSGMRRVTLTPSQVIAEAAFLHSEGFKHVLLVSGECPSEINSEYLFTIMPALRKMFHSISIEIAPLQVDEYSALVSRGVDGVTVYQETYEPVLYKKYHPDGNKGDFQARILAPETAGESGMRKIGMGSLLGLNDWRFEAISIYYHIGYIYKKFWKTQVSLSFPRIQSFNGKFSVPYPVNDRELVQMICAMRLVFPDLTLVLSTRESQHLRDGLARCGITQMSAGSRTDPGGYLHHDGEHEQFSVRDKRSPRDLSKKLRSMGYDIVWKDWEGVLSGHGNNG